MRVTGSGIKAILDTLEACPNDGLSHNASMAVIKDLQDARDELDQARADLAAVTAERDALRIENEEVRTDLEEARLYVPGDVPEGLPLIGTIVALENQRDALREKYAQAHKLLVRYEFPLPAERPGARRCPECGGYQEAGHQPGCAWAAIVAEAEAAGDDA
jgi:hypothetical protein